MTDNGNKEQSVNLLYHQLRPGAEPSVCQSARWNRWRAANLFDAGQTPKYALLLPAHSSPPNLTQRLSASRAQYGRRNLLTNFTKATPVVLERGRLLTYSSQLDLTTERYFSTFYLCHFLEERSRVALVCGFDARGWQRNQPNWVELLSVTFS